MHCHTPSSTAYIHCFPLTGITTVELPFGCCTLQTDFLNKLVQDCHRKNSIRQLSYGVLAFLRRTTVAGGKTAGM